MATTTKKATSAAYMQNNVMTASPVKLVKLLYDGAMRHMEIARTELSSKETCNSAKAGDALGKSLAILGELRASLDMQAGAAISIELDRLYEFAIHSISEANNSRDPKPLVDSIKVVRTLKGAWDELASA